MGKESTLGGNLRNYERLGVFLESKFWLHSKVVWASNGLNSRGGESVRLMACSFARSLEDVIVVVSAPLCVECCLLSESERVVWV